MKSIYTNICHNPRFTIWPWGTSGFTGVASDVSYGRCAARWKLQTTAGGTDAVSASKGTNSEDTGYDKWLRGESNLTLDITSLSANNTMKVRQRIEGWEDFGQNIIAMTVIASGPAGGSFYAGVGSTYEKIKTLGDDDGVPILVTKTATFAFDDPVYHYMNITPFESPSTPGTYRLHHVQCEVFLADSISGIELRSDTEEWDLIKRYITPITQGMIATGASSSQLRVPVAAPTGGWYSSPTIPNEGCAATVNATLNSAGSVIVAASPTFGFPTDPQENTMGAVVLIGGFSGVASASQYVLGPETEPVCYLDTDI